MNDGFSIGSVNPVMAMALAATAVGLALVVLALLRIRQARRNPEGGAVSVRGLIPFECTVCHKQQGFRTKDLVRLSAPELGLVARARPDMQGRPVAEHICPYCEASHYFVIDGRRPHWIGVNLYSPQSMTGNCCECRKPLVLPPWEPGRYDGRLHQVPDLLADYGVVCSRCGVVVCVACATKATWERQADGAFRCPRCFRYPVDKMYHGIGHKP